jgi:CDP-glycerol glycerophosphotransferase (TagB/SpsB family)
MKFIFKKRYFKLILIINILIVNLFYYKNYSFVKTKSNSDIYNKNYKIFNNEFNEFNYVRKINDLKIIDARYCYSFKYNIVKLDYSIGFYDEEENLISPTDISLYYNKSILCNILIEYNINIDSLANIKSNKYFNCVEFYKMNEKIAVGIKIYNIAENNINNYILLFTNKFLNYNIIYFNVDKIFNFLIINNKFNSNLKKINNKNFKLKNSYIQYPLNSLKRNCKLQNSFWKFENIFGEYFCFCKAQKCLNSNIDQFCKYNFYIYIIDNNRDLYLKTEFLFVDFIFSELASDDVYPIFKEMEKQNYPVHYITEKIDIYQIYCKEKSKCLKVLQITRKNYFKIGDVLEKYLIIFLKSKAFISAKSWDNNKIADVLYNIEYITYIGIGHGVCYFKDYLYKENRLYGSKKNDKILIPPSKKFILMAKKHGWKDENIIKINLPRWDKYNNEILSNLNLQSKFKTQSMLFMFTWRNIKPKKDISSYYIENIITLLTNTNLTEILNKNNISLYFTFHRYIIDKYKIKYIETISKNKYIKYIEQNDISDCLSKTSLVVSDFSSIIFDMMYRRKPFILYIPDANDPDIRNIYFKDYSQLIESLKNRTFYFENTFFDINSVVEKIIYYINNNFNIEQNLTKFYNSFELKKGKNINYFIKYLVNLK